MACLHQIIVFLSNSCYVPLDSSSADMLLVIFYSSVISLKSLFAPVAIIAGRLSDAGTSVGFPCGFFTYSPSISEKVFFPISFSISVIEIRLFL